jgi:hypothetical protein
MKMFNDIIILIKTSLYLEIQNNNKTIFAIVFYNTSIKLYLFYIINVFNIV